MASGPTWRAGPPRRCDVALRPRDRTRVAHAGVARGAPSGREATRPRGRPCVAPRVLEYRGDIRIINRGSNSPI